MARSEASAEVEAEKVTLRSREVIASHRQHPPSIEVTVEGGKNSGAVVRVMPTNPHAAYFFQRKGS